MVVGLWEAGDKIADGRLWGWYRCLILAGYRRLILGGGGTGPMTVEGVGSPRRYGCENHWWSTGVVVAGRRRMGWCR